MEDLSRRNFELVRFERVTDSNADPCAAVLDFPNQWYVGSKTECSCTFRHLMSIDLGFSDPVDWYKEELDELDATRELYSTLVDLLSSGHNVDLIDRWEGAQPEDIIVIDVSVDAVSKTAFRMFENYNFKLMKNA